MQLSPYPQWITLWESRVPYFCRKLCSKLCVSETERCFNCPISLLSHCASFSWQPQWKAVDWGAYKIETYCSQFRSLKVHVLGPLLPSTYSSLGFNLPHPWLLQASRECTNTRLLILSPSPWFSHPALLCFQIDKSLSRETSSLLLHPYYWLSAPSMPEHVCVHHDWHLEHFRLGALVLLWSFLAYDSWWSWWVYGTLLETELLTRTNDLPKVYGNVSCKKNNTRI